MAINIFDKITLKNSENLSSHNFTNDYTLRLDSNISNMSMNNEISNEDIIYNSTIEGVKICKEEERKLDFNNESKNIKVTDLPIFPNLSE